MNAVEFDFVVKDSLKAIELYQAIFEVNVLEKTNLNVGSNEVVFEIFGSRFHMLDENPDYQLFAPKEGQSQSFWFNVIVSNIDETYRKALDNGVKEIQAVTRLEEMGVSNAMFLDPFGYVWMLHEIHREVSFEDRVEILSDEFE
ncbi:VOC family protein [Fundicoccus culcitae]|uniref:VOC family protein n=1 Tax=Fundicoccus culcitae TaxID=2969821 RepID=A0ABY5P610_9LACT|nr:VOC family protein [Fundicoccus culcitae]UUX33920.1 VOC family protein [Fundicoccus culcitae]